MSGIKKKSHAYIISSADEKLRDKAADELACSFICEKSSDRPCMECPSCRNAIAGLHPDVINILRKIDDKGKAKRDIQVDQIREMAADAYVRPQQAEKKVYIIREAGLMNSAAQNAALKILEEPPAYDVFILCAESAETLLATIRSRCVVLYAAGERQEEEPEAALEYISLAAKKKQSELCKFFGQCESMDSEQMQTFINGVRLCLKNIITLRKNYAGLSQNDAVRLLKLYDRADEYLHLNVGVKHIFGMLCVLTA